MSKRGLRPGTPTKPGWCPTHGEVLLRGHRTHSVAGYYWRCPDCHSEHEAKVRAGEVERHHIASPKKECEHRWERDEENDEDWCHAWVCRPCGVVGVSLPGERPNS